MVGNYIAFEEFSSSAKTNIAYDGNALGVAQNANKTLKAAGAYENGDNIAADNYTVAAGINGTVNTGSTTGVFVTNKYTCGFTDEASGDTTSDPNSYTNVANAFDDNDTTFADKTGVSSTSSLGKTFSSKYVAYVNYKGRASGGSGAQPLDARIQTFDGSVWTNASGRLNSDASPTDETFSGLFFIDDTIQGIRMHFTVSGSWTNYVYTLEYGGYSNSTIVCDTSTITLDGTETAILIYSDQTTPTNTSMTVDIGDGSTTLLSAVAITKKTTGIRQLTGVTAGTLELTFNQVTTDVSVTPTQSGYGVIIWRP